MTQQQDLSPYLRNRWFQRYGGGKKIYHLIREVLGEGGNHQFVSDEGNFGAKSLCGRKMELIAGTSTLLCNSKWTCTRCMQIARGKKT